MIAFVRGKFAIKTPARVVVDVNGVGYDLQISLNTYSFIANKDEGLLHTYIHLYENGQTMYGFADVPEKEMFLQLISVSGFGAATARMMLSGMRPDEIAKAIVQGNTKQLEGIKGIGKKSAERLIVELRDKLSKYAMENPLSGLTVSSFDTDAINALIALGINKLMAENAVKKVLVLNPDIALEDMIKQALKNL
ncbi:MAG: Holliday junction branch migration protein RuvA [Deinococcales bacterium]|nr:Holliday junction branch migration protein RuvA [Chitinophagaceae bacterium]